MGISKRITSRTILSLRNWAMSICWRMPRRGWWDAAILGTWVLLTSRCAAVVILKTSRVTRGGRV